MSSIDDFHKIAGIVFARLFAHRPEPQDLGRSALPAKLFPGADESLDELFGNALHWLRSEAFISYRDERDSRFAGVRLSDKGLEALALVPPGLAGSVGDSAIAAVEAGDAGELVRIVKLAYGIHMRDVLSKVVLGVMFDHWSCNHYPEGLPPGLAQLGCDSGCRC
jgi:hypothetical protein